MKIKLIENILPVIIMCIILLILKDELSKYFSSDTWTIIYPGNKDYDINHNFYLTILFSGILLGYTVLQTFFEKSNFWVKLLVSAFLILFTLPLYMAQSKFVIDDVIKEKKQNEKIIKLNLSLEELKLELMKLKSDNKKRSKPN
ncbi:MAG: hypothetical protein C0625_00200 [Arcobacter sp.]|nr:MAG: hypothetical protein C0625_00200 [Arcobacter sp.]